MCRRRILFGLLVAFSVASGCGESGDSAEGYLESDVSDYVVAEQAFYETPVITYVRGTTRCGMLGLDTCSAPKKRIEIVGARVCDNAFIGKSCGNREVFEVKDFGTHQVRLQSHGTGERMLVLDVETEDGDSFEDHFLIRAEPVGEVDIFRVRPDRWSLLTNRCREDEQWLGDGVAFFEGKAARLEVGVVDEHGDRLWGTWSTQTPSEYPPYDIDGPLEQVGHLHSEQLPVSGIKPGRVQLEGAQAGTGTIRSRFDDREIDFEVIDDISAIDNWDAGFSVDEVDDGFFTTSLNVRFKVGDRPLCSGPVEQLADQLEAVSKTPEICAVDSSFYSGSVDISGEQPGTCRIEVTAHGTNHGDPLQMVDEIEVVPED